MGRASRILGRGGDRAGHLPFWILLNDFLTARQDRPSRYALAALLPGFLGVAIVAWQAVALGGASLVSIIALLAAALSWSVGTVLSRNTSGEVSTILLSGMQLLVGGVALFAIAALTGEMRNFSATADSAASLEALVCLTLTGSVIGFAAYHWLLKNVPTQLVATYTSSTRSSRSPSASRFWASRCRR